MPAERTCAPWFASLLLLTATAAAPADDSPESTAEADSPFVRQTIDIGVVCSDVEKSRAFYENVVGFQQVGEFTVPAEMGRASGLADGQPFTIQMLALGKEETATKLKLMQFPKAPGARQDLRFIHNTLGVSYLTIVVKNLEAAVARAKEHGVKPLAKGITPVPDTIAEGIAIVLFRDPDGNFVELVGPQP